MRLDALIMNLLEQQRYSVQCWQDNYPGHALRDFDVANLEALEVLSKQLRTIRKQIVANK
jgi:hypothetical protein